MKKYDYFWAKAFIQITGVVFISQLIIELVVIRKPEFWWVIYACLGAFVMSILYSVVLYSLNRRN